MSGINKVILVGHLGKDPDIRHLEGGISVATFPLATSETYNKDGRRIEQTEWHNIVMWRGLADVASKYLQKGKLVYIEGKLRTRHFEDKEGHKKQTTEIVADNFTMLGRKSDYGNSTDKDPGNQPEEQPFHLKNDQDEIKNEADDLHTKTNGDDLPF